MKTRKNTKKSPKKARKRKRRLPAILTGDYRREEQLMGILDEGDPGKTLYVYRAVDDWPIGRFLFQGHPFPELHEHIRDKYGSGEYAIIIRKYKTMIFSGITRIEAPIGWRKPGGS